MNTFIRIVLFSVLTLSGTIIVSCSSEDTYYSPLQELGTQEIEFENNDAPKTIPLSGDITEHVIVESSESWCWASIYLTSISVGATINNTYDERQAVIKIKDTKDNSVLTIQIKQKQKDALHIETNDYIVSEEGGYLDIPVNSNVAYQVDVMNADWIKVEPTTRGMRTTNITLDISKNNSGDERKATVKVNYPLSGLSTEINIKQLFSPDATINQYEYYIDENGGEIEVPIITNIPLECSIDDSWIILGEKSMTDTFSFIQKFKVNKLLKGHRKAEIWYNSQNPKWGMTFAITIDQSTPLYIDEDYNNLYIGDSFTLKHVNNTGRDIRWKSSNESVALVDNNGLLNIIGLGSATIELATVDNKYSDELKITVIDILSKLENSFSVSWSSIVSTSGSFTGYILSCELKNKSDRDINLDKCYIYYGNSNVDTVNLSEKLKSGKSKTVQLRSNNAFSNGFTFVWEFTLNGKSYSYRCMY